MAGDHDGITKFYGINGIMEKVKATELRGQGRSRVQLGNEEGKKALAKKKK